MAQVHLDDPRLQALELNQLITYLQRTGWHQQPVKSPYLILFVYYDSGEEFRVPLPTSKEPIANLTRYAEAVRFLADFEDRSVDSVFEDLQSISTKVPINSRSQSSQNIEQLGLKEIPFTESPTDLRSEILGYIFTGRETELRQVFNQFQSRERRRILVSGHIGIGKSAFILEVLSVLRRKRPKMLTTYISLPPHLDLATTALIALAKEMSHDDWAQRQLYQMGIPTQKIVRKKSREVSGQMVMGAKASEKDFPIMKPLYPSVSLITLLERAYNQYPDGIVIAIDDLDKQEPIQVRELMYEAQGILKGRAWFLLTAHPFSLADDLLTSERGLFDLQVPLDNLDQPTTYKMLINYLNSARINKADICNDIEDPRSVYPFTLETAKIFCQESLGKPRLFNRLGNAVLSAAADRGATQITNDILQAGLQVSAKRRQQQAALTLREEQVRQLLQEKGVLSDENISLAELEQLGCRSFVEILPILEKLEDADLAHQLHREGVKEYIDIPISPIDPDES